MACLFEWETLTLNGGWTAAGSYQAPSVRLEHEVVRLVGVVIGSTGVVATLDTQYRPSARRVVSGDIGPGSDVVEVDTNGDVIVSANAAGATGVSLEGSFPL